MPKGYCSKQDVENYTLQSISASFDLQMASWIEAIEKFIDQATGRNFIADESASEKLFDGNGRGKILIDDFVVEEADEVVLKIGETEIESTEFYLYPANSTKKNKIILTGNIFSVGNQNISVEARWGYSADVPADVKLACTILVAGILSYSDGSKGKVRSESVGRYSVSYADDKGWNDFKQVMKILDSYKKYSF